MIAHVIPMILFNVINAFIASALVFISLSLFILKYFRVVRKTDSIPGDKVRNTVHKHSHQNNLLSQDFERLTEPFIALDRSWRYVYVNKKACEIMGKENAGLIGKTVWEVFPASVNTDIYHQYHRAMKSNETVVFEHYYPMFGRWLENHIYPSADGLSVFYRDITLQKKISEDVSKANRLYHFTSQINQMLLRNTDEKSFYHEVCSIAIETGKFRMAWVGLINSATRIIEPIVFKGVEDGYLSGLKIYADQSTPESRGPVGLAVSNNHYAISNDMCMDERLSPWQDAVVERNFHSVMAVPIHKGGIVVGVFCLYADKKNFFDEPEIRLILETTGNLSYGLDQIEKEKWRNKISLAIMESEQRYQTLAEVSPVGIFHTDMNGFTTYVNPFWTRVSGMKAEDALGNGWLNAVHPADRYKLTRTWDEASKEKQSSTTEYRFLRKDGTVAWVLGQATPEYNLEKEVVGYVGTITDITERKMAEIVLKETTEKYKKAQVIGKIGHWELDMKSESLVWSDEIFSIFNTGSGKHLSQYDLFLNAIHPADLPGFMNAIEKVLAGQGKLDYTHRIIGSQGIVYHVQQQGERIYNAYGQPILTGTVCRTLPN